MFSKGHTGANDADLVKLASNGDQGAFRELLKRHQEAVYRFAWRFLGDRHEAEDIAQETFLRLYRSSERYQPTAALRTYLLKIAKNLCVDHLRKKRPELMEEPLEVIDRETPLDELEHSRMMALVQSAVRELPDKQRTAILLRHDQGLRLQRNSQGNGDQR